MGGEIQDIGGGSYPDVPSGVSFSAKSFPGDVNKASKYPDLPSQGSAYQEKAQPTDVGSGHYPSLVGGSGSLGSNSGSVGIGNRTMGGMDVNEGSYPTPPNQPDFGKSAAAKPSPDSLPASPRPYGTKPINTGLPGVGPSNYTGYP